MANVLHCIFGPQYDKNQSLGKLNGEIVDERVGMDKPGQMKNLFSASSCPCAVNNVPVYSIDLFFWGFFFFIYTWKHFMRSTLK